MRINRHSFALAAALLAPLPAFAEEGPSLVFNQYVPPSDRGGAVAFIGYITPKNNPYRDLGMYQLTCGISPQREFDPAYSELTLSGVEGGKRIINLDGHTIYMTLREGGNRMQGPFDLQVQANRDIESTQVCSPDEERGFKNCTIFPETAFSDPAYVAMAAQNTDSLCRHMFKASADNLRALSPLPDDAAARKRLRDFLDATKRSLGIPAANQ